MNKTLDIYEGIKKALPIVLGYLPLGFAYGALANLAGLSLPFIVLMSVLVFAGSGQFIAVSMISGGAGPLSIIATVFLVNLRHLLMSASLAPLFRHYPRGTLPLLSFWLTDENFAMASGQFKKEARGSAFMLALFGTSYSGWVVGGALGGKFGDLFSGIKAAVTMEYALYAMFIFLLVIQVTDKKLLLAACTAGGLSLVFYLVIPGSWYIILATVITATLGVGVEKWMR